MENYLVIGSGISGINSVMLLEHMNEKVTLYDGNEAIKSEELRAKLPENS